MPLSKIELKPGVNKEGTRYSTEGGWFDSDKVRFRKGLPEKIGGWQRFSNETFLGIARSIHTWRTLASKLYVGVGTHLKFYVESGNSYNDITPLRKATITLASNPIITTASSTTVRIIDTTGGYVDGDFVTLGGTISTVNGVVEAELKDKEFQISVNDSQVTAKADGSSDATVEINTIVGGTIEIGMIMTGTDTTPAAVSERVTNVTGSGDTTVVTIGTSKTFATGADLTFSFSDSYTITIAEASGGTAATGGGGSVTATYQINTGSEIETATDGWSAGGWSVGTWSNGLTTESAIRLWSQANFGEDLILSARGGPLYYWSGANLLTTRAVELATRDTVTAIHNADTSGGASTTLTVDNQVGTIQVGMFVTAASGISSITRVVTVTDQDNLVISPAAAISNDVNLTFTYDLPTKVNRVLVSDISRFVFCFGTTAYLDDTNTMDPLLLRWSDQENATQWSPSELNLSGSLRLSRGGEIITAVQARQEILVWTDAALYNLQFLGTDGWGAQLVGENVSIASPNAVAYANGIAFWMGQDKFYSYDGNVKPIVCTLDRHVFGNLNRTQAQQIVAGTNEAYNEVWWFYPTENATENDRYVVYNYLENIWYHGTNIKRTAWEDSGIRDYPIAATSTKNLVNHEYGVDDNETSTPAAVVASITSAEFDLQDGHQFAFVWRMLPDITFDGSTEGGPSATFTLNPLKSSGAGFNDPLSEGGSNTGTTTQSIASTSTTIETYTTQIPLRLRGRQMSFKIESSGTGVKWQLGYPRIDMRPDGRR